MQLLDLKSAEYVNMTIKEKVAYWRDCIARKVHTKEMMIEAIAYLREGRHEMSISTKKAAKATKQADAAQQGSLLLDDLKKNIGLK